LILLRGKGTADMTKDLSRGLGECLEMLLHIGEQKLERAAMMIMCHDSSRDAPEPFDAVGVRIVGRRIHQAQMLLQFGEHAAHKQGACRSVGPEIVGNHDGNPSTLLGTSHSGPHLLAEHFSGASRSDPAIEPALAPVHQAKAVDLLIAPRRFDQTLPVPSFPRPRARQRRVKGLCWLLTSSVGKEAQEKGMPANSLDSCCER